MATVRAGPGYRKSDAKRVCVRECGDSERVFVCVCVENCALASVRVCVGWGGARGTKCINTQKI